MIIYKKTLLLIISSFLYSGFICQEKEFLDTLKGIQNNLTIYKYGKYLIQDEKEYSIGRFGTKVEYAFVNSPLGYKEFQKYQKLSKRGSFLLFGSGVVFTTFMSLVFTGTVDSYDKSRFFLAGIAIPAFWGGADLILRQRHIDNAIYQRNRMIKKI